MENKTKFKQTFSGSVGAGMGAVFNGGGKRFFILEHKVSSTYHKAGESQQIIIDNVLLGRSPKCQVRFDESFTTVSREHAAIMKEGDNYVLVQISKTNTTFLNGVPVTDRWYLQNGDEIQLSKNGPKIGFIIPQGDKSLVKSIGMTARLNLFRKQALLPYKKALTVISVCLLLAIVGGGGTIWYKDVQHKKEMGKQQAIIDELVGSNLGLKSKAEEMEAKVAETKEQLENWKKNGAQNYSGDIPSSDMTALIEEAKQSVCYTETYVFYDGGDEPISVSTGTGFFIEGKFVTARHCVEPWNYSIDEINAYATVYDNIFAVIIVFTPSGKQYTFKSTQFKIDRSKDEIYELNKTFEDGTPCKIRLVFPIVDGEDKAGTDDMWSTDWAYVNTETSGNILAIDADASVSLKAGSEVHVLGYPAGLGVSDGEKSFVEPIYNKMSVARDGLNNAGCIMVSQGVAHGNSGGPVFAIRNGKMVVIGIVSRLESATQRQNAQGNITQQQQQYDQLIPIKNILK